MATDQEIRDAGLKYIPQQKYLQNPYELPVEPEAPVTDSGIVNTNSFMNSGQSGSYAPNDLMTGFNSAIDARQNRLQNPDKFSQFLAKFGIGGQRSVDQMMRDATAYNMNELGPDFSQIGITNDMTGQQIRDAMAEYAGDETSIGNYPVDNPRDVRKNMFGLTGILSKMLPSSYYDKMTMPQQIYTQSKMGYTGPTIFGENTSGGQKDVFGRNVISGFGNYAEKQAKDIKKLDDLYESDTFTKKYGNLKLEEDDEGIFGFTGGTEAQRKKAADMHKLNLIRYNFDKKGLKELNDIENQTGFTGTTGTDNGGDSTVYANQNDPSSVSTSGLTYDQGGGQGGSYDFAEQNFSEPGNTTNSPGTSDQGYTDSGDYAGLARGGRAGYFFGGRVNLKNGGLVSLL